MKITLKNTVATLILSACAFASSISADTAVTAKDECARELLLSYFPEPIVNDTLKKFDVPQDKWGTITKALSAKDKDIVKLVEQKASSMNPNPLKDPQQRQAAVKLFRETLLQVFSDALTQNGFTDQSKYQAMLDDIQQQKAKKFAMCLEKQKGQPAPSQLAGQPNIEEDDDSDDDSDEDSDEESDDTDSDESDDDESDDEDESTDKT